MRIASVQIFNIANNSMADVNESMLKTQEQLSTGRRVLDPSDDPVASTKILAISSELATIEQYQKNIDLGKNSLVQQESILNSVNALIQRIQELSVQAGNTATLSPNEYNSIAAEVDSRIEEMQGLLNTQNVNGDYIFGGYKSTTPPFVGNSNIGFEYVGDDGQITIQIANNTTVPVTDSGKRIFVDVQSQTNTIRTSVDPNNTSVPPIYVTVGQVIDQEAYDDFYPEDIVIKFNADSEVLPPGKNFSAYEKSTGRLIVANQPFLPGADIEIEGTSIQILGTPVSGVAAVPATREFGIDAPGLVPGYQTFNDFTPPADETFEINLGGRTEVFTLDQNITSVADIVTVLNDAGNGNAAKLANLGLTVDPTGINSPSGKAFTVRNASSITVDNLLGIDASSPTGSVAANGTPAQHGDVVYIDSSKKQDILTTMSRFSNVMKAYDGSPEKRAALTDVVNATVANLALAQTSVLEVTSSIGARFNTMESTEQLLFDTEMVSRELMSRLRDIDYAETATRLSQETLILEATQQTFVRVSRLNLFSQL